MFRIKLPQIKSILRHRNFSTTANLEDLLRNFPLNFTASLDLVERADNTFQTGRSLNNDIISDKNQITKVQDLYVQTMKALTGQVKTNNLTSQVEPRLLTQIDQGLKYLEGNNMKMGLLGSSILGRSESEIRKSVDVNPIGYLKIFNVDVDRKKNLFIHQYVIDRTEDRLSYSLKEVDEEKTRVITKKEKTRDDMIKSANATLQKERPVKDTVMWIAKKVGLLTPEDLRRRTNPLDRLNNLKSSLFNKIEGEDYILVEDFEILSPLGLYILNKKTNEIVKSEGKDGGLFRHFVRIETIREAKDAPSIRKQKGILLSDFDFFLRGNPHTLVKDFTQ